MENTFKKEILLKDLKCDKCLRNIEEDLKGYNICVSTNSDEKTISFDINSENTYKDVINKINKLLRKHEHKIKIEEVEVEKTELKSFVILNLGCANCAKKIEKKVRTIEGIKNASIDFATSKIHIEFKEYANIREIMDEVNDIVGKIENGATICNLDADELELVIKDKSIVKNTILTFIFGGIFFIAALFTRSYQYINLGLYIISYLIIGRTVITKAARNIIRGEIFDENFLMLIATIGAFVIREYNEAVAVMAFYLIGEMFQDLAVDKTRKSISDLMDIRPDYANLQIKDDIIKVRPEDVEIHSLIVIKPGERVPIDGIVVDGGSFLDTSSITGESVLRRADIGDEVLSGFINKDSLLLVRTTKLYNESTVNIIIEMVENASSKKSQTENFITKFAKFYTPIVILVALALVLIPVLAFNGEFTDWLYRSLSFLVISCPCAFVISVPLGFYGGIGLASKNGILVKGGNYLEALNSVDTVVFDKTGTLTKANFVISKIEALNITPDKLIEIAAHGEFYSNHPISNVIKDEFKGDINKDRISNYQEIAGNGIKVFIDGDEVLIGNNKLLETNNIEFDEINTYGTIIYVAINSKFSGAIIIVDEIKEEAIEAIVSLKNSGIKKTIMLTGDKKDVAISVANEIGIDEVYSELLPNEKVDIMEKIVGKKQGKSKVAFVGDGINDAPVLAISDIGISMGSLGSDAAIEASDVVIMNDNLAQIAVSKKIAKKTKEIVLQNIIFSISVKVIVLILAAFGFANMWAAVFADVGVSLIAVLNAVRILKTKV